MAAEDSILTQLQVGYTNISLVTRLTIPGSVQQLQASIGRIEQAIGVPKAKEEKYGANYPTFTAKSHSLLKKHLSIEVYEQIKDRVC